VPGEEEESSRIVMSLLSAGSDKLQTLNRMPENLKFQTARTPVCLLYFSRDPCPKILKFQSTTPRTPSCREGHVPPGLLT
jgi:hypothetical protein